LVSGVNTHYVLSSYPSGATTWRFVIDNHSISTNITLKFYIVCVTAN